MAIIELATHSRDLFFFCVEECNTCYGSGEDLSLYRQIIDLHRESGDLANLLDQPGFINLIRRTLIKWNMDQRAAKLESETELNKSITQNRSALVKLYNYKLHELTEKTTEQITTTLDLVFGGLKVMRSKRRIVGVSKTLHFLLPDLVMPIDSEYTMPAIYGYNKYSNKLEKETEDFIHIFKTTVKIAQKLNLTSADVTGEHWNTSIPKLIDNAIIGLFKVGSDKLKEKLNDFE